METPPGPDQGADELIAAIGNPAETWAKDRPPCGMTVFDRVFAVRHGDYGYEVLAPSNQVSAVTQCPPPPPATVGIGLEVSVVDGRGPPGRGARVPASTSTPTRSCDRRPTRSRCTPRTTGRS